MTTKKAREGIGVSIVITGAALRIGGEKFVDAGNRALQYTPSTGLLHAGMYCIGVSFGYELGRIVGC